jgi:hypothetical protein
MKEQTGRDCYLQLSINWNCHGFMQLLRTEWTISQVASIEGCPSWMNWTNCLESHSNLAGIGEPLMLHGLVHAAISSLPPARLLHGATILSLHEVKYESRGSGHQGGGAVRIQGKRPSGWRRSAEHVSVVYAGEWKPSPQNRRRWLSGWRRSADPKTMWARTDLW